MWEQSEAEPSLAPHSKIVFEIIAVLSYIEYCFRDSRAGDEWRRAMYTCTDVRSFYDCTVSCATINCGERMQNVATDWPVSGAGATTKDGRLVVRSGVPRRFRPWCFHRT